MAAAYLAENELIKRFNATDYRDTVVFAGFGRFGQSMLEELEQHAGGEFSAMAIIDIDARPSTFAAAVCKEYNIVNINMTELMEEAIPRQWYLD